MTADNTALAERAELATTVRAFLDSQSSLAANRERMLGGSIRGDNAWQRITHELCLTQLAVPEELGGIGASFAEVATCLQETGRVLSDLPYLGTTVAISSLLDTATSVGMEMAARIALEGGVAAVGLAEEGPAWRPMSPATTATAVVGGHSLSGVKSFVMDAVDAQTLVVSASLDGCPALFAVSRGDGVRVEATPSLDLTRPLSRVHLDRATGVLVSGAADGGQGVSHAVDLLHAAIAAESAGAARRTLEATVEYLKVREQFGRPIGGFQALKHRCADIAISVEGADATAQYTASIATSADFASAAPLAKLYCTNVFLNSAAEMIQLHGGIGFTWEHDAHLYFKRAKSSELLFGSGRELRRTVAERAGILRPDRTR